MHLKGPLSHDRLTATHPHTRGKLRDETDEKVSRVHLHVHAVMKAALALCIIERFTYSKVVSPKETRDIYSDNDNPSSAYDDATMSRCRYN